METYMLHFFEGSLRNRDRSAFEAHPQNHSDTHKHECSSSCQSALSSLEYDDNDHFLELNFEKRDI
jgi:hypothetical protein